MQTQGIGRTLRVEREARRVSLDTISRATNVRRDYLELIDEDLLHRLPPGAYAKGFIRAYAQYLGVDPKPLVLAYEQQCEQPAPELSSVVRHPVRVPNAAQPRAWRLAAGAAVSVLFVLGLLGLFRSGESEAPPVVSPQDMRAALSAPVTNPLGAVVRIRVEGTRSWVECEVDGKEVFGDTLVRGQEHRCQGEREVTVTLGNPSAVRVIANGTDVGVPPGADTYRGRFTPSTDALPPSESGS